MGLCMLGSMDKNQAFSKRLGYAINGISGALRAESSFRTQATALAALLVFCVIVRPPAIWVAIFVLCSVVVLSLELINTALETLIDHVHPERAKPIGFAKDCSAGAVLVASVGSTLVFLLYLTTVIF